MKKMLMLFLLTTMSLLLIPSAGANLDSQPVATSVKFDPWPQTPPKIGRLELKQEYWNYMKEAARRYKISPYLIQAMAAIESRYDPRATSGRGQCVGLMQLHRDTARKYGVDPWKPRENIMGGAAVLAKLLETYNGDLRRVLRVYNATSTAAYEREVFKAFNAAMSSGRTLYLVARLP